MFGFDSVMDDIETHIAASFDRYGDIASTHESLGVALEEWDELRAAIRSNDMRAIDAECIDLAAVLIRLARSVRNPKATLISRSTK